MTISWHQQQHIKALANYYPYSIKRLIQIFEEPGEKDRSLTLLKTAAEKSLAEAIDIEEIYYKLVNDSIKKKAQYL